MIRRDSALLQVIPARPLNCTEHCHHLLPVSDVLFAFAGSPLFRELADKKGARSHLFRSHRLYLQTNKGVYFSSSHRSLKELCGRVSPDLFLYIQKSLVVNIQHARRVNFREKQIGIGRTGQPLIWLNINRHYIKNLRRCLFFPGKEGSPEA